MRHAFMVAVADGLARRGISVLRFQFRYMEAGGKRPDPLPPPMLSCAPQKRPPLSLPGHCRCLSAANRLAPA